MTSQRPGRVSHRRSCESVDSTLGKPEESTRRLDRLMGRVVVLLASVLIAETLAFVAVVSGVKSEECSESSLRAELDRAGPAVASSGPRGIGSVSNNSGEPARSPRSRARADHAAVATMMEHLVSVYIAQRAYEDAFGSFASCAAVPDDVPVGILAPFDGEGLSDWETLAWMPGGDVACQYTVDAAVSTFEATAECDLDGDAEHAMWSIDEDGVVVQWTHPDLF